MQRDVRTYLWEALQAAELVGEFTKGEDFASY